MINAFITAIYNKLKANTDLMTKLGGVSGNGYKCYNILAYQDAALPYIVFGLLTDIPMGVFGDLTDMENATIYLNIFSESGSAKEAGEILDLVKVVLDDADLTISGYANDLICAREFVGAVIYDPDIKVYQIPMRYRVLAEKD